MPQNNKIPLAKLPAGQIRRQNWVPDRTTQRKLARDLGISDIRKVQADVTLTPQDRQDWHLKVRWGATVVQPCVTTLEPVTTRLEATDTRTLTTQMPEISDAEAEMPSDDTLEPLKDEIDLEEILQEMIALALPTYPRSADAQLSKSVFGPPGTAAMTDEAAKPFAGLSEFRKKMSDPSDKGS